MYSTSQLIGLIRSAATRYGIDPNIAVAQLDRESVHFKPYYVYGPGKSPAGAMGLAQFMPGTWAIYGQGNPYDPVAALEAWGRYMSHLLSIFGGRYDLALAGYNWGENRSTLRQALSSGRSILDFSIPSETRGYVSAILGSASASQPFANVTGDARGSIADPFGWGDPDSDIAPYALPPSDASTSGSIVKAILVVVVGLLVADWLTA